MSLYTKRGDDGTTSLSSEVRVNKNDTRIEFFGSIDELNAFIGLLVSDGIDNHDKLFLENIQKTLFLICTMFTKHTDVIESEISDNLHLLENEIDDISKTLSPLSSFILPGGSHQAALCNVCRTVCRRAERCLCAISPELFLHDNTRAYINRLSDYLFVLYRKFNFIANIQEKKLHNSCE